MDWTRPLAYAGIRYRFAPGCPVWPTGLPRARLAATERAAHAGDAARTNLSFGFHGTAVRDHLLEHATRGHRHAVIVSAIDSAKLPASTATVETLKEVVPRATPCVCLDGVGAILLE